MIIFINGSINSGKTTISKMLAEKIGKIARIEVDDIRNFISWMPIMEAIPINLENTVLLIKNFLKNNIDVIVPYPLSRKNYDKIMEELKEYKDSIYVFTLSPKLDVVLKNRGSRELSDFDRDRIKYHYSIGIPSPDFGYIIDNSEDVPEETVGKILRIINKK